MALILVELFLAPFNALSGKTIATSWAANLPALLGCLGLAVATGLLSGIYPALFLSSFRPIRVLKGALRTAGGGPLFRKALVIVQFTLSVFLITGTAIVSRQMAYMRAKDLGFDKERIIHLRLFGELTGKYAVIKERLLQDPGVASVTASLALPIDIQNSPGTPDWEGKPADAQLEIKADFEDLYRAEARMGTLFRTFAALAVLIACLGLFGLASYMAEQRTKEIGIRRILGASVPAVTAMMSREFAGWVLAANLVAWPAAWFFMGGWLKGFAYRAALSPWSFIVSGAIALAVALVTVGSLAARAAVADPADALRYE